MENKNGIILIILVITIIIMIMIAGTIITVNLGNLSVKNLTNMYADLKTLDDKIDLYYAKYGVLPIKEKYTGSYAFTTIANSEDDEEGYYVIDIKKLDNVILTKKITGVNEDVYIINTKTHVIYYPEGVSVDGKTYYKLP